MLNVSNVSNKINVVIKTKINEKGKENLRMKLKSYNLGKEFNYAIAVLKLNIVNGESEGETKNSLVVNLIPKVQYITPFVSEKLAKEYHDELFLLDKLIMFLEIGEDGRVVLEDNIVDNVIENICME